LTLNAFEALVNANVMVAMLWVNQHYGIGRTTTPTEAANLREQLGEKYNQN